MEIKEIAQIIKEMKPEDRQKLVEKLENSKPSIFERFPVGSYICGMKVFKHDKDAGLTFGIELENGYTTWLETKVIEALAACHDWIERYTPFLESARVSFLNLGQYPLSDLGKCAEKVGLWDCQTLVKKPWEEAHE